MEFCPTCGMLLKYELPHMSRPARFFCPTCPYVIQIETKVKIKRKQRLVKKEIDPIITKDDMSNAPKTDQAHCPNCGHNKAAYIQFQTRSADEPMTINFTCEKCGHCWRED
ncbi:DNA-directed RNA polymerase III subunit RPC10-like isoform X1 [Cynara cardunculus var. scolymus]|uniref:DNA-directed RNA polymerase subunit n=1 Tax=Cynara cardunculus var. scolymus TaxID=59895 RepID=A0A118JY22_CYNCS|nr:DNA-directed RNA polymerase III subunit RPC10-like isoform X1 [Cynara cardunculus var. scolymus]KVH97302.1 DNA-directed RNA polymerase, M/15kDa subunit [Cynara cardunculus var. scolymus]